MVDRMMPGWTCLILGFGREIKKANHQLKQALLFVVQDTFFQIQYPISPRIYNCMTTMILQVQWDVEIDISQFFVPAEAGL
jgi:hypothetical protein